MKKLYWRPGRISWQIYVIIALIAITGIASVEIFKIQINQPYYKEKMRAARIMRDSMAFIKEYRLANIGPLDPEVDPTQSGMIGQLISPITSNTGYLEAKLTTTNPNWAAVIVEMLKEVEADRDGIVAMGFSGSFPAINLAALAAARALDLKVVSVASMASSTWGANIPELTWLDMERILNENGLLAHRSVAASWGGQGDRAIGMSKAGKEMLRAAVERNGVTFLNVKDEKESMDARMAIFQEFSEGKPFVAYVNVGGGAVSVGSEIGKKLLRPGLNRRVSPKALTIDGVTSRFAKESIPIIHMSRINLLAERYGLPIDATVVPKVGEGAIFSKLEYNRTLVLGVLILLVLVLYVFIKLDVGYRIFAPRGSKASKPPEPMV